jgi:hypothetical protein
MTEDVTKNRMDRPVEDVTIVDCGAVGFQAHAASGLELMFSSYSYLFLPQDINLFIFQLLAI